MQTSKTKDQKQTFLITGASSGLGLSVAQELLNQNKKVILVARDRNTLENIKNSNPENIQIINGDLTSDKFIPQLVKQLPAHLTAAFINAGGPPAGNFSELSLNDWDNAYNQLIRWKVQLTKELLPIFIKNAYGRILYSESTSVNRPIDNLTLSNSLRMAIVGLVKSLVKEYQGSGITFNVIAPGYHKSKAIDRLYKKLSDQLKIPISEAENMLLNDIPSKNIGKTKDFASLAGWLLSPSSAFVTGQVYYVDGGLSV